MINSYRLTINTKTSEISVISSFAPLNDQELNVIDFEGNDPETALDDFVKSGHAKTLKKHLKSSLACANDYKKISKNPPAIKEVFVNGMKNAELRIEALRHVIKERPTYR